MDFTDAVKESSVELRESAIRSQIESASWDTELDELLAHGGYADDFQVFGVEIREESDTIIANCQLSYSESAPTGCKDLSHVRQFLAYFQLRISKNSGEFEIDNLESEEDESGGSSIRPNDDYI